VQAKLVTSTSGPPGAVARNLSNGWNVTLAEVIQGRLNGVIDPLEDAKRKTPG
jgi:hypothetical protein